MAKKKRNKKADVQKQMNMFDKLPSSCLVCGTKFDKKNREMVMKWKVVVINEPATVKLYCPSCWEYAESTRDYLDKQNTTVNDKPAENEKASDSYGTWNYNLDKMRKK